MSATRGMRGDVRIPMETAFESIEAIALRIRWYDVRGLDAPFRLTSALRLLAAVTGVDEKKLR